MAKTHITRESQVVPTFRVEQIRGMFDVPAKAKVHHEWDVDLPLEDKDWKIGVIVGPSGAGKSTIASECFPGAYLHKGFEWPYDKSVLDGFDESLDTREITEALSSVGFSSPPFWLKPHQHLSNGQKFRCELARSILLNHPVVIFDEFTSVVDRDVAKICSAAVSKFIRRRPAPKFIAVSCHYDIIPWLEPDWVYDVGSGSFDFGRLWRRPKIELSVRHVHYSAWRLFRGHHYLSSDIAKSATCFVAFWNERPVAFAAAMPFPHGHVKRARRAHRTVVLPDFQGVGIGNKLSEYVAERYVAEGYRYFSVTSHPAMIRHRMKSGRWKLTRKVGHGAAPSKRGLNLGTGSVLRLTAAFEYINKKKPVSEPLGK